MRLLSVLVVVLSGSAWAHIKLLAPASFQVTDEFGGPQKVGPCGEAGTATGVVTTVEAGSQLTVTWKETILHPGHFRIGLAQDASEFVTPEPMLSGNGTNCASAPIMTSPVAPILVDGLFPHTTSSPNGYTTKVTVPMMSCDHCVLQLMQFMSSHAPACFYYQCATLRIVMPDGGVTPQDEPTPPAGCGCTGTSGAAAVMLLLALASRRRHFS